MDPRVREFVETAASDVVGLDAALFYQANPCTFDTAAGLAMRLHRHANELEPALERLAESRVLEVSLRGEGRYRVYALNPDPKIWALLCALSEAFLEDADARKEIIRLMVQRQVERRTHPSAEGEG